MKHFVHVIAPHSALLCRKYLLVDPTGSEETVMDGTMVVCMNIHRELCTVQMTGSMLLLKDQVNSCQFLTDNIEIKWKAPGPAQVAHTCT